MIDAVNRHQRIATTDDGRVCEITNFYDCRGDETDDVDAAIAAVVKISERAWMAIDLRLFTSTPLQ